MSGMGRSGTSRPPRSRKPSVRKCRPCPSHEGECYLRLRDRFLRAIARSPKGGFHPSNTASADTITGSRRVQDLIERHSARARVELGGSLGEPSEHLLRAVGVARDVVGSVARVLHREQERPVLLEHLALLLAVEAPAVLHADPHLCARQETRPSACAQRNEERVLDPPPSPRLH